MITQDQLEQRRAFIGGSDAGAILGLNPYMTARDVYKSKIKELDDSMTERQLWGNLSEPMIATEFARRTGFIQEVDRATYVHKKYDFLGGHIDRRLVDANKQRLGILEIKTRDEYFHKQLGDEICPTYDYAQIQHYYNITGFKFAFYAVLAGNKKLEFKEVEKDTAFIAVMQQVELDFWKDFVLKEREPGPDYYDDLDSVFKNKKRHSRIEATPTLYQTYLDLKGLRTQISVLGERAEDLTRKIKLAMGENEILCRDGAPMVTWKVHVQNRVSVSKLKAHYPRVYEKLTEEKVVSRFEIL